MKAQTQVACIAIALGGIAATGISLAFQKKPTNKLIPSVAETTLNQRIRSGIIPLDDATRRFGEQACYISEARWKLNADPFEHSKVAWMGLSRDIEFKGKYLHGFVVVYDKERKPIMALHTMPNDRSDDPLPNAMGDRNCVIDVYAVTMDANAALREKRGHSEIISSKLTSIKNPRQMAARLNSYIQGIHQAEFKYSVPIQPVRRELLAALQDDATLTDFPVEKREQAAKRRNRAQWLINKCSDVWLARALNPATKYRLRAKGYNSNTGGADLLKKVFACRHSLQCITAPFCDESMYDAMEAKAAAKFATIEKRLAKPQRSLWQLLGPRAAAHTFA